MDRRDFVASIAGACAVGLHPFRADASEQEIGNAGKAEHCIFIWLGGGMSQIDTFDPKQRGDSTKRLAGTDYAAIDTAVPGVQVCEHLKRTAERMDRVTAIRTVHHEMIDEHAAAVYWVHIGRPVNGTIQYPSIGSAVAHQLGSADENAPPYVVIGYPNVARSPGFLGPKSGYLYLTDLKSGPRGLTRPDYVTEERQLRRFQMLQSLRSTMAQKPDFPESIRAYDEALSENLRLSGQGFMPAFDIDRETAKTRQMYGSELGQRCLLARRLTEHGVRFVEVSHTMNFVNGTGWDTHQEGHSTQWSLIQELDQALAALIDDLEDRNRLDKTLIVIASEFGRPAEFDAQGGRGHQSTTFSVVLAGGGLKHCGAIGVTDQFSKRIIERPVSIPDLHATIHHTLGIDYQVELYDGDRPVPITDRGQPVGELFA